MMTTYIAPTTHGEPGRGLRPKHFLYQRPPDPDVAGPCFERAVVVDDGGPRRAGGLAQALPGFQSLGRE